MSDAAAEQVTAPPYHLPENEGYPEAIRDPVQQATLVSYFWPHIKNKEDERMLRGALYNPLNIEYLAGQLRIPCPQGYSAAEMEVYVDATLNVMVPCRCCGDPIRLHGQAYKELGGRCHWDCFPFDGEGAVDVTQ